MFGWQSVSPEEAIRLTREIYGLEVQAQGLPGEYDHNFHLTTATGQAFVLKIMHPDRPRSIIELQSQALQHLARRVPHLVLPRVQLTRSGQDVCYGIGQMITMNVRDSRRFDGLPLFTPLS